jgi:hypothetical protein
MLIRATPSLSRCLVHNEVATPVVAHSSCRRAPTQQKSRQKSTSRIWMLSGAHSHALIDLVFAIAVLLRGVITQALWHVRSPRGVLEDAFGSSATTGGLLPRCRYVWPLESHFFDFRGGTSKRGENFPIQAKKNQNVERKLPDAKKHSMIPLGAFRVLKGRLDCDTSHESEQRRERW